MNALWIAFDPLDRVFLMCAVFGGLLFVTRMIMSMFGGEDGVFGEGDIDMDGDAGLTIFSLQTITAFFTIFGLAGLALHRGSGLGEVISIIGAFVAGSMMVLVMAKLAQMFMQLNSSGNLDMKRAIGHSGSVYLTIQKNSTGKVQIEVGNRLMTVEATAEDKREIKTGERVEVVDVVGGGTLVVRKV